MHRTVLFLLALLFPAIAPAAPAAEDLLFTPVANREGNPYIRSILRLDDGRMAFATLAGVELFDGSDFTSIDPHGGTPAPLPAYRGYHHLYISHAGRYLWIKNLGTLQCIDLDTETYVPDTESLLRRLGASTPPDDFFGDSRGRIWTVNADTLHPAGSPTDIILPAAHGPLLDLAAGDSRLHLFFRDGTVLDYTLPDGAPAGSSRVFTAVEEALFGATSLVTESDGILYQIRNGTAGGFFRRDPATGRWEKILQSGLRLNTLAVAGSAAYISTNDGLLAVDLRTGSATHIPMVRTRSGNLLSSEISSVAADPDGGIWLGFLNRGIFHYHPAHYRLVSIPKERSKAQQPPRAAGVFSENPDGSISILCEGDTGRRVDIPSGRISTQAAAPGGLSGEYGSSAAFIGGSGAIAFDDPDSYRIFIPAAQAGGAAPVRPVISALYVNGEKIVPQQQYDGRIILTKAAARASCIELGPDQNFLAFRISDPDASVATATISYMLDGLDREWHTVRGQGDRQKSVTASYTALSPGSYTLLARTGADAPAAEISVTVLPHWWQTGWFYAACCLLAVLAAAAAATAYTRATHRRIAREQREAYLLQRIRTLIEEVDRYRPQAPEAAEADNEAEADNAFIAKAVEAVERNLNTPGYSVTQLSADLCMDRTGLYRKLNAMLDKSPSLFIRDIRLRNAARLIREGKLSITEIAEQSGFSSTSYMSKCFQERYGCRPSEYR